MVPPLFLIEIVDRSLLKPELYVHFQASSSFILATYINWKWLIRRREEITENHGPLFYWLKMIIWQAWTFYNFIAVLKQSPPFNF